MQETQVDELSPAKKQQFVEMVMERFAMSKRVLQTKHESFIEYLNMYYGVKMSKRPKGMANLPVALVQESVDSLVADMMDKMFQTDLQIETRPRERMDENYAQAIRNMIKYQAYYDNWKRRLRDICTSFVIFGNAPAKVMFDRRYGRVMRRKPIYYPNLGDPSMPTMMGQPPIDSIQQFTTEILYQGPTLIPIDIFDFYPHEDMVDVDDDLDIIHRFNLSPAALVSRMKDGIYENVPELLALVEDSKQVAGDTQVDSFKKRRRELTGINYTEDNSKFPEFLEWQGRFDINDDGEDELCVGVVANVKDGMLMRLDELPYFGNEKTYIFGRMFRVQGEFWGIGLVEKMANDQKAATSIRNCLMDNMYNHSRPRTFVEENSIGNESELDVPRGIVHVIADDRPIQQKVFVEPVMPIGEDGYRLLQDTIQSGQAKGGVNDMKAGRIPGQATTATVGSQAFSQASIRFKDILWMFENSIIIPLCDKAHAINQQFIDKPYAISIIGIEDGKYWQIVDPTQIAGKVNFESLASTKNSDKAVNIEQLMRAIQVAASNPMLAGSTPILFTSLMREWGVANIDEIKVAIGYQAMMTQLYQAAQMQLTPMQMMAMNPAMYGQPLPLQKPEGNQTPYGGVQEQTPTNQEELIAKVKQPMTENFPLAR